MSTLTRAAELLELNAAELLLCHATDGDWDDEHEAREAHDEMMQVAADLRAMIAAAPQPPAVHQGSSPTAGMTLWQRIEHVGGRINAASYVEFGSVMAVDALISHVLRDLPPAQGEAAQPADVARLVEALDWIDDFIARCNGDDRGACEAVNRVRAALAAKGAYHD